MNPEKLKNIIEAALLVAGHPLTMDTLLSLFDDTEEEKPGRDDIRNAITQLEADFETRGVELKQVASGYRIQVKQEYSDWMSRLWNEKPARYSRALLETLALIAYRQPTTRAEIEDVRGVAVSSNIIRTLLEREWIRVVGHRDVPGKPAMFGTTKLFLDYFNLKTLSDLPTLADIRDIDEITGDLFKEENKQAQDVSEEEGEDNVISIDVATDATTKDEQPVDQDDEIESETDDQNDSEQAIAEVEPEDALVSEDEHLTESVNDIDTEVAEQNNSAEEKSDVQMQDGSVSEAKNEAFAMSQAEEPEESSVTIKDDEIAIESEDPVPDETRDIEPVNQQTEAEEKITNEVVISDKNKDKFPA